MNVSLRAKVFFIFSSHHTHLRIFLIKGVTFPSLPSFSNQSPERKSGNLKGLRSQLPPLSASTVIILIWKAKSTLLSRGFQFEISGSEVHMLDATKSGLLVFFCCFKGFGVEGCSWGGGNGC